MKNTQNITIVLLLAVTLILSAMIIGVYTTQDAKAEMTMKAGRYIMCSASIGQSKELVYLLDMQTKQINCYIADMQGKSLERIGAAVQLENPRTAGPAAGKP